MLEQTRVAFDYRGERRAGAGGGLGASRRQIEIAGPERSSRGFATPSTLMRSEDE
jgi:hypothetical protein